MTVSVLGCGRWGGFLAWYLHGIGVPVCLWGRASSLRMQRLMAEHKNEYLSFDPDMAMTTNLDDALISEVLIVSIDTQQLRGFLKELAARGVFNKSFVFCMKGLEIGTGARISEIAKAELDASNRISVWLDPGHAEDFALGIPGCMVLDSEDAKERNG